LVDEVREQGVYDVIWDGTNDNGVKLASGIYIYRITAVNFSYVRKLILIK
jgi:flagellar hook assembly protein FlgD